jgi:cyclophilin family peptidyl-prolyl cis-trans isomerase
MFDQFRRLTALVVLGLNLCCGAAAQAQGAEPIVMMQTSKGPIVIQVFLSQVPYTSRNFLDLVQRGFYNGLSFHRVERWCIQGGDPLGNGHGNFVDPDTGQVRFIRREINPRLHHFSAGVVAMARGNNPDSASCQFYITKAPAPFLDGQYAIFGRVVRGLDTVMHMAPGDRILSADIVSSSSERNNQQQPAGSQQQQPVGESGF